MYFQVQTTKVLAAILDEIVTKHHMIYTPILLHQLHGCLKVLQWTLPHPSCWNFSRSIGKSIHDKLLHAPHSCSGQKQHQQSLGTCGLFLIWHPLQHPGASCLAACSPRPDSCKNHLAMRDSHPIKQETKQMHVRRFHDFKAQNRACKQMSESWNHLLLKRITIEVNKLLGPYMHTPKEIET